MPQYETAFIAAVGQVLSFEGGLSNDPDDPGGLTKYGISQRSYPTLDIRNLTQEQAIEIYYRDWWRKHNLGIIPDPKIAAKCFSLAVNMGPKPAFKLLQSAINATLPKSMAIAVDGVIGPKTLSRIRFSTPELLLALYKLAAVEHYAALNKPKYLKGWIRRAIA